MPPKYLPVQKNRFFAHSGRKYDQIAWNNFPDVIQAFQDRITGWYINPIHTLRQGQNESSFAVAGLTCLLIDTLSQYVPIPSKPHGALPGYAFKEFIRQFLPHFSVALPVQITHYRDANIPYVLTRLEDVIYHALRCGILHEAHATLYCGIYGLDGKRFKFFKAKYTKYASNGRKCLTVVIDPNILFTDTLTAFNQIMFDLGDSNAAFDPLRVKFKMKFTQAFGVPV
jgi:hypothetical protein